MRRVLGFLLAALAGCQAIDAQTGIVEGTTVRVEASMLPDKVENPIKIFPVVRCASEMTSQASVSRIAYPM